MWDDALDREIDRVAREMTAGEPHGDFRARVVARVETVGAAPPKASCFIWTPALTTAAFLVIALVAYRQLRPDVGHSVRRESQDVRLKPDTTNTTGPSGPDVVAAPSNRPALHTRAAGRVWIPQSPVDALAPPPLTMDSLAVDQLSTAPLDVMPLENIAPIAIIPIGDEGDRR